MSNARKVGDFYEVDGFTVYQNYVVEDSHTGEIELSRTQLSEFESEDDAKKYIDEYCDQNPTEKYPYLPYYEKSRILV